MNHRTLTAAAVAAAIAFALAPQARAQTAPQSTSTGGAAASCWTTTDGTTGTDPTKTCATNTGAPQDAQATGSGASAFGWMANASGWNSTAVGFQTAASGANASAFGNNAQASGDDATALGFGSAASGQGSTAIGGTASGANAIAISGNATGTGSTAIAGGAASATNAVALGLYSSAQAAQSFALMGGTTVAPSAGDPGAGGTTGANFELAIGPNAWAYDQDALAIGRQAAAQAGGVALGFGANAGAYSQAFGWSAAAAGNYATAFGSLAYAQGNYSVALGYGSTAVADTAVAIGGGAQAGYSYSVALGEASTANRVSTVSVGNDGTDGQPAFTRAIANVSAGAYPTDAVNLAQLNAGGNAIATWFGAGASFNAAGGGAFTAPSFVLTNPYSAGTYNTVAGALAALDNAVTDVSKQPGPQGPQGPAGGSGPQGPAGPQGPTGSTGPVGPAGPQGPQGATGATGPAGPAGTNGKNGTNGSGTTADPLAVRYDDATDASVTLQGANGTTVRNVAAGVAPTDAANVSQINKALQSAKTYTDIRSVATLNQANAYTDTQVGRLNLRVNYALAAAAANANAAAAVAGQDPTHHNRVAVSDGLASGVNAWTAMYQHKGDSGVTWNVSLTGEQGGGSSSERQVGVGIGYSW